MNILLVDDHQMTIEGYASILQQPERTFYKALSCEQVFRQLEEGIAPDIAVIDFSLPPFPEQNLYSGADCAVMIRQYAPHCKIFLITAHDEALILHNIQKTNPDALLVKSDVSLADLKQLVNGTLPLPHLSKRAKEALHEAKIKETLFSATNIEILMYLSNGFKSSEIADFVNLTQSAVNKRLSKMQTEFKVSDHYELIQICKKQKLF